MARRTAQHTLAPVQVGRWRKEARAVGVASACYRCRCGARLEVHGDIDAWSLAGHNAWVLEAVVPGVPTRTTRLAWGIVPDGGGPADVQRALEQVMAALARAVAHGCPATSAPATGEER